MESSNPQPQMSLSPMNLSGPQPSDLAGEELAAVEKLQKAYHDLRTELGKVIVGQEAVIEELLVALFCRGHALLVGCRGWPRRC